MSVRVDATLLPTIEKYGNADVEACFNCGNCTAICPLTSDRDSFPRRLIRYAQVGMKEQLLGSRELWLCYACGECTATCPREADPTGFMAAARRYAIAQFDPLGLARRLFLSPVLTVLVLILMSALMAAVVLIGNTPMPAGRLRLFEFIPPERIHDLGVVVMAVMGVAGLIGVVNMVRGVRHVGGPSVRGARLNWLGALWETVGLDVLTQRRYRDDCTAHRKPEPWYLQQWLVHLSIMWGFLGLLGATALDYLTALAGIKPVGTPVPLWDPIRLLGTIAGVLLVYGTTVAFVKRIRGSEVSLQGSHPSDWAFLTLMWLAGASGLILELFLYTPVEPAWGYSIMIFHVAVAMTLVLMAPFTKFAHAMYRTVALYAHALKPVEERELGGAASGD